MLIRRTIESSRCGRPRWHRIQVISGEALLGGGGQFHVKLALIRKYGRPKIKFQAQFLRRVKFYPVPIGLTWEQNILVLKPSPCLHNGNEADDWMGLDEWNT
ncbi:uncharacterized protein TNCV_3268671 [Trichonephila clavipes]|nr:uncharacterized protein TNCV_3268671 [Trichonephila clavipes]